MARPSDLEEAVFNRLANMLTFLIGDFVEAELTPPSPDQIKFIETAIDELIQLTDEQRFKDLQGFVRTTPLSHKLATSIARTLAAERIRHRRQVV